MKEDKAYAQGIPRVQWDSREHNDFSETKHMKWQPSRASHMGTSDRDEFTVLKDAKN